MHCIKQWNSSISCKGCGQQFKARTLSKYNVMIELSYYRHCFDECEKYKQLDLIRRCECNRRFINFHALTLHCNSTGHKKPTNNQPYLCEGCGQTFNRNQYQRKKYVQHCVEFCDEYRKLNLIKTCSECKISFRNIYSLKNHKGRRCRMNTRIYKN